MAQNPFLSSPFSDSDFSDTPVTIHNPKAVQAPRPGEFDALFEKYGTEYGISPSLLRTIAIKESGLNPNAVGKRNENGTTDYGLMQHNDRYHKERGITDWRDPDQSVRAAAKLLADNLRLSGGNLRDAVRRYNGSGPRAEAYADDIMSRLGENGDTPRRSRFPKKAASIDDEFSDTPVFSDADFSDVPVPQDEFITAPEVEKNRPGIIEQAGNDLSRGLLNLKGLGYGAAALATDALGLDSATESLLTNYLETQKEAKKIAPVIGTYKNINSFGDAGRYAVEAVAENLPMMLPSIVSGGVGAIAARKAAEKLVGGMIEKQIASGVAKEVAEKNAAAFVTKRLATGGAAGAGAASIGMESGSIYGDIYQETGEKRPGVAAAFGVVAGSLDAIPAFMAVKKALGPTAANQVVDYTAKAIVKRFGAEALKQLGAEGLTEGMQTIIEKGAVRFVDGKPIFNDELTDEVIDSVLKGGIAGSVIGAGSQGISDVRAARVQARVDNSPGAQFARALDQDVAETDLGNGPIRPRGPLQSAVERAAGVHPDNAAPATPRNSGDGFAVPGDDGSAYSITTGPNGPQIKRVEPLTNAVDAAAEANAAAPAAEVAAPEQSAPANTENTPAAQESAPAIDLSGRTDQQLQYLATNGQPGHKEAAIAELQRRGLDAPVIRGEYVDKETGEVKQKKPKADLRSMSDEALVARMDYLRDQAKSSGGWNNMLVKQRQAVVAEQERRAAKTEQTATDFTDTPPAVVQQTPAQAAAAKLPKDLAGAKPRSAYGDKQFDLTFASDIDKAAYIAAQKNPSKRDADYVKFVADATGMSESEIRAHGAQVRAAIKAMGKDSEPGVLTVPEQPRGSAKVEKAPDYEQRNADRLERVKKASAQEEFDAITAEEHSDGERHFEGTDRLRMRIEERKFALKVEANKKAESDRYDSGEWVIVSEHGSRSAAEQEAADAQAKDKTSEYKVSLGRDDGWSVQKRKATEQKKDEPKPKTATKEDVEHLFGIDKKREKALERIARGTAYFNDGVKAKDFIKKNGLSETHEAKQGKGGRWDIVAKSQQEAINGNDERAERKPAGAEEVVGKQEAKQEAAAPAAVQPDTKEEVGVSKWREAFNKAKSDGDKNAIQSLYDKISVALNGIAQKKGDAAVSELSLLKSEIEDYAKESKRDTAPTVEEVAAEGALANLVKALNDYGVPQDQIEKAVAEYKAGDSTLIKDLIIINRPEPKADKTYKPGDIVGVKFTAPDRIERARIVAGPFDTSANGLSYQISTGRPGGVIIPAGRIFDALKPGDEGYTLAMAEFDLDAMHQNTGEKWFAEDDRLAERIKRQEKLIAQMKAEQTKPAVSENKIFTEDGAAKARALLKSKLGQLNSGVDPEVMQAGIYLTGYHLEKGARTFVAYAKAMIEDLGEIARPHLKSWYLATKFDPRASSFEGMSAAAEVEAADIEQIVPSPTIQAKENENANTTEAVGGDGDRALEGAPTDQVRGTKKGGNAKSGSSTRSGKDAGRASDTDGAGAATGSSVGDGTGEVPVPARGGRGKRGSAKQQRVSSEPATQQADERDVEVKEARQEQKAATDYRITDLTRLGEGGQKTKYRNNIAAIRLLNELQQTGRQATPEEQDALARYVGWGGIPQAFDDTNKEWAGEYAELKALLTPEEWDSANESTQYAHYTSQEIIGSIYDAVKRFGFGGGKVLEPGSGVGNFMGLLPDALRGSTRFTAVERERIAGGIAHALYPNHNVQQQDFRYFNAQDGYFDLAIGNPPFSSTPLTDMTGRKHLSGLSIHNYFFAKSIDMLREGGVLAMVVSNSFLDAKGDKARKYIGERTEFLGAIRLPNKAFSKNANTEVTTDIIFLKKRPESEWGGKAAKEAMKAWQGVASVADPLGGDDIALNQYFADHPEMMLGRMERAGSMYGPGRPALIAREGQDTAALLAEAVTRLPEGVFQSAATKNTATMQDNMAVAMSDSANVDVGGHYVEGDKLFVRIADEAGEKRAIQVTATTKISEKKELGPKGLDRLKQLADMRGTVRGLLAAEIQDAPNMEDLRAKLNDQYDAYVKKYGLINQRGTVQLFGDDPDFPLLASLEHSYDPGIGDAAAKSQGVDPVKPSAKKAPIFSRRVIERHEEITKAESPEDALMVSIAERGQIDAEYIGSLLGRDGTEVLDELTKGNDPALYVDPATGGYALKDAYLSGNVRKKMAQAKAAGMYQNVAALEKVIPEDIPAHEISGKIGAPWIPTETYEEFAKEIMGEGTKARVVYVPAMSSYVTDFTAGSEVSNTNTYGTREMGADKILSSLMNSKDIKVGYYEKDENGGTRFVLDKEATDAANDKAREIKEKFSDWLFSAPERAEKLQRSYNDAVNNYVTRIFDGSMLKFIGKVPDLIIKLRRHQRNAVARIIQEGRALLDHVVGAGKTFTVIAAAMELKRTGLAKKPMIVVPNHLVKQWAADFYRLYPGANILTATKKDFEKANRRKFLAKIATGNWDAVIIAHSSFGFIKPDMDFETSFNNDRINEIVEAIQALKDEKDQNSKRTVKQLAKMKESLDNKLKSLRDKPMDDLLDFGQLGVDQLFVDEAHLFKNLMFVTKMQNVRGLGQPKGSQRAYDMFIKTHQLYEKSGNGRGVVFATGTPVSNSLAEMYHMLRYLAPETLKDSGQFTFDAWAKTFADVEQVWMQSMSGDGYKASNRMSVFANTPELLRVFDQVADTVTIDDIKTAYAEENDGKEFPIPKLKGGRRTPVSIERSQNQIDYMGEIAERAKKLEQRKGKPQKGDDNMLSIMGDARKAAMDIRMVRPDITERDPNGRISIAANNIAERYKQYDHVRGTQLVFSDMGTPKKHADKELKEYNELMEQAAPLSDERVQAMAELGDEDAMEQIEKAEEAQRKIEAKGMDWLDAIRSAMRGFSIYDDMKQALIERGIPENEIAFIHDYNTDDQKAALFRAVNDGKIRVLLGSTEKMGAGTNVQERAVALHHLDVPWKPSDIEQREGRVIRQGNSLIDPNGQNYVPGFEVEVMAYATQDTLDLFMWQTQEKKLSMIAQLRTGNVGREVDNAFEEMQMSAGEMQAAATSNPYLLEEIQLKDKIKKLERQKRSFDGQKNDLVNRLNRAKRDVQELPARIKQAEKIETAAKEALDGISKHFSELTATVNGEKITGAANIRAAVRDAINSSKEIEVDGKIKRVINIEFNGNEYLSEGSVGDAVHKANGDASETEFTLIDGTTLYRSSEVAAAVSEIVAEMKDGDYRDIGKIGAFDVTAYRTSKGGDIALTYGGIDVAELAFPEDSVLAVNVFRSMPGHFKRGLESQQGLSDYSRSRLEQAKRTIDDIEKMPTAGEWPGEAELKKARGDYREVLKKLAERAETKAEGEAPAFSRSSDGASEYVEEHFWSILEKLSDRNLVEIDC